MITIALLGAGGKMGCRTGDGLRKFPQYNVLCVETGEKGLANLAERGLEPTPAEQALAAADVLILAVPDIAIKTVAASAIPQLKPGALIIGLDPAAAYAGVMPIRDDLTYFVSHPCHPRLFDQGVDPVAQTDWFGGIAASQAIVNALYAGDDRQYELADTIAKRMFAPVTRSHRITVEQMAILEPGIVETTMATLLYAAREAMDQGIRMGVPREAAEDFCMGHMRTILAIVFGYAGFPLSDGAIKAVQMAKKEIFRDDWQDRVLSLPAVKQQVRKITGVDPS